MQMSSYWGSGTAVGKRISRPGYPNWWLQNHTQASPYAVSFTFNHGRRHGRGGGGGTPMIICFCSSAQRLIIYVNGDDTLYQIMKIRPETFVSVEKENVSASPPPPPSDFFRAGSAPSRHYATLNQYPGAACLQQWTRSHPSPLYL